MGSPRQAKDPAFASTPPASFRKPTKWTEPRRSQARVTPRMRWWSTLVHRPLAKEPMRFQAAARPPRHKSVQPWRRCVALAPRTKKVFHSWCCGQTEFCQQVLVTGIVAQPAQEWNLQEQKNLHRDLHQQPADNGVRDRNLINVATLQFWEKRRPFASRPDVLLHCKQLLEVGIVADRVPDWIDFQARDGNFVAGRNGE